MPDYADAHFISSEMDLPFVGINNIQSIMILFSLYLTVYSNKLKKTDFQDMFSLIGLTSHSSI